MTREAEKTTGGGREGEGAKGEARELEKKFQLRLFPSFFVVQHWSINMSTGC